MESTTMGMRQWWLAGLCVSLLAAVVVVGGCKSEPAPPPKAPAKEPAPAPAKEPAPAPAAKPAPAPAAEPAPAPAPKAETKPGD